MSEISLQLASAIYERKFAWKVVIDLLSSLEWGEFQFTFLLNLLSTKYPQTIINLNLPLIIVQKIKIN